MILLCEQNTHVKDSLNIANAPSEQVKANLRTTYGMNIQSPFCVLTTFDVTKQLPQDIIDTLLEGDDQYEARLVFAVIYS